MEWLISLGKVLAVVLATQNRYERRLERRITLWKSLLLESKYLNNELLGCTDHGPYYIHLPHSRPESPKKKGPKMENGKVIVNLC